MQSLPELDTKTNINYSPHVVLLGSGASLAAFPDGDANGNYLPLMSNLIEIVGLNKVLEKYGIIQRIDDFEAFYDDLVSSGKNKELVKKIQLQIYWYFHRLDLPDKPTIYDYLILALREKDLIATFNWDPFLAQAYQRHVRVAKLPQIVFLHGNVEIGVCFEDSSVGFYGQKCSSCGKRFETTQLLYPVKHKNYQADSYIKNEWQTLKEFLNKAYLLTIFGYSAPITDVEAKSLLLRAWKNNSTRVLAEIEIIDVKERKVIESTWKKFFVDDHYGIKKSIFDSYLFAHPRRSCDAFAMATLQNDPWHDNKYPCFNNLEDMHQWLQPLISEEEDEHFSGMPCSLA